MKVFITKEKIQNILIQELEYEEFDVSNMSNEEKIDCFLGSGYFEDESDFGGIIEVAKDGILNFEDVVKITGVPISLDTYFKLKKTNKKKS